VPNETSDGNITMAFAATAIAADHLSEDDVSRSGRDATGRPLASDFNLVANQVVPAGRIWDPNPCKPKLCFPAAFSVRACLDE